MTGRIQDRFESESENNILIRIANITVGLSSEQPIEKIHQETSYKDFYWTGEPDIRIQAFYGDLPPIELHDKDKLFDSGGLWSLYQVSGKFVFVLKSSALGSLPYRMAIFDADFQHGKVYSRFPIPSSYSLNGLLPNPLEYPLSEATMICILAQERGLLMHACGIDDHGRGYLFAGNSTHGKTTIAQLWKDEGLILNDDRIVLRQREGRYWMYGTPWHGKYTGVSPQGIPLEKIFFLKHAQTNTTHPKHGVTAATMLLARSFPPFWNHQGMQFTLDFCARVVKNVPCYELEFTPDQRVLDAVRCAM